MKGNVIHGSWRGTFALCVAAAGSKLPLPLISKSAPLLLASFFLPSCGKEIVVQRVPVPEKWLTCAAQPKAPDEDTDKAVATFIVDLIEAGEDCRATVAAIKAWNKQ
jgi:hypothetical protein